MDRRVVRAKRGRVGFGDVVAAGAASCDRGGGLEIDGSSRSLSRLEAFSRSVRRQYFRIRNHGERSDVSGRPGDGNAAKHVDPGKRIFRVRLEEKSEYFAGQPALAEIALWRGGCRRYRCVLLRGILAGLETDFVTRSCKKLS